MKNWSPKKESLKSWSSPRGQVNLFLSGRNKFLVHSTALPYLVVLEEQRLANALFSAQVTIISAKNE